VRVSRALNGGDANGASSWPSVSADGRFVAFTSDASNLVKGDNNGHADVFVHDTHTRMTTLLSQRPDGKPGNGASRYAVISGDGRAAAFQSLASDLICIRHCTGTDRDINLVWDVFVWRRGSRSLFRASADETGEWMEGSRRPMLDAAGRVLIFSSRHPIDDEDMRSDDDLFIHVRAGCCVAVSASQINDDRDSLRLGQHLDQESPVTAEQLFTTVLSA
jgi:Tol biopolymer transport system component